MKQIKNCKKNLNLEIKIGIEIIANQSLNEEKKDFVNRLIEIEKNILNQKQRIEKINAKINIIIYWDSIREVLFSPLTFSISFE